jgi:hypothetical protein
MLWAGVFALRLLIQLPLYITEQIGYLGTARLLMGVPLFALTIWISWLLLASPLHAHRHSEDQAEAQENGTLDAHHGEAKVDD